MFLKICLSSHFHKDEKCMWQYSSDLDKLCLAGRVHRTPTTYRVGLGKSLVQADNYLTLALIWYEYAAIYTNTSYCFSRILDGKHLRYTYYILSNRVAFMNNHSQIKSQCLLQPFFFCHQKLSDYCKLKILNNMYKKNFNKNA